MNLYLDLYKAVQIPSMSTDAKPERRAARQFNESFTRRNSGVVGGDLTPDDPDVGRKWRNPKDEEKTLDDDLEEEREEETKQAADRGIIPKSDKKKEENTKKALDICKSLSSNLSAELRSYAPNVREVEFLTEVRGYPMEAVLKGQVQISGRERSMFSEWLTSRLQTSINRLPR